MRLLPGLALATAAVVPVASAAQEDPTGPGGDVVTDVPVHDPVLVHDGERWYLFGTGRGVRVWSSADLRSWRRVGRVFESTPEWVLEILPDFDHNVWAPDVFEHDGTYFLYYSVSRFGRNDSAIGVATSPTLDPEAPDFGWEDHGPVVRSVPGRDMWNAIDAHLVRDEEGTPWMTFGSHWGGIKLVRMDPSLTRIAEPQAWWTVAARHRYWKLDERDAGDSANPELDYGSLYPERVLDLNRASQSGAVEAPTLYRRDGWYYLFVSWDRCCRGVNSTYKVVVGRSREITGPYVDRAGEEMRYGGGSVVTRGFAESERWAAGGHQDVVRIDGADWLVFHAYDASADGRSKLLLREIRWDAYGWPTVEVPGPPGRTVGR